jgi:hypothetical protein
VFVIESATPVVVQQQTQTLLLYSQFTMGSMLFELAITKQQWLC